MEIQRTRDLSNNGGFTLIALVAVIAIMAILVALFVPALARARKRGQEVVCLANVRQLTLATHLYAAQNRDRWIGNGPGDPLLNLPSPPKPQPPKVWVEGHEGNGPFNLTEERRA